MTTLDELLALLPDNTTGEISAEDLRTIVTALWERDDELDARLGALEVTSGLVTVMGKWQINQTAGAAPAATQVTKDAANFATATWLRFTEIDLQDRDLGTALMQAEVIYAQMERDRTKWVRYNVTGAPTDAGAYVQVPVAVDASGGGTFTNWQNVLVVIGVTPAP